jgi:hypothetical protein
MAPCRRRRYSHTQHKRNCGVFLLLPTRIRTPQFDFLHRHVDYYQIELVHLNPNSILQITVFVYLSEAFLQIPSSFLLFKNYFFLKYQPSAANHMVVVGVGHQTRPCAGFFDIPLKTSLQGWHGTWFYCENHEPSLPSFVGQLPDFQGTWNKEPTPLEVPLVSALTNMVNLLNEKGLMGVCMAPCWLAHRVQLLKKQVHPGWQYSRLQDPTRETQENITPKLLVNHLGQLFQDTSSWPTDEQVRCSHIRIRRPMYISLHRSL